ncbi:DUF2491 family protein [Pseudomonas sp. S31]|uniref:DUF2491 family protein n=2 Tax=Gammaproteobacteria TaxID=1236 RepID=UPI001913F2DF|nr:DUF2491 family protein [Pseudomonas sp. S31]MBK4998705.1 DUF2491 family protein [Pseudomonas sp. S31]MDI6935230.1 DUF2491 family protein [Serratia sp. Se-PFBMAAmG]
MSPIHLASPPFGLLSGSTFTPAASLGPLLSGFSELQVPGPETIAAVGEIDLGQSVRLLRFYMDNEDYWLQVLMHGREAGDIVLFGYHSAQPLQGDAQVQELVGGQAPAGLPIYSHEGYLYSRQWGREEGRTPWVELHEQVTGPAGRHGIRHLSMLYARDTGLAERREFLLLSLEEDEQGALLFTTSLGTTLFPTDFHIT